jgi:hypothetical protein
MKIPIHRLTLLAGALLAAGALFLAGSPARAQDEPKPLIIGANRVLTIRVGDTLNGREMSVQDRINHIQDVLPKHLGGALGKITSRKWGDRVHLYLNGDFVLAVTPADAKATGYKTAEQLAPIWAHALDWGFQAARVRITPKTQDNAQ